MAKKKVATKKVAAKKTTAADRPFLSVYSVAKKGWVEITEKSVYLEKTSTGSWMLRGVSAEGGKLAGIVGKAKAQEFAKKYPKAKKVGYKAADLK